VLTALRAAFHYVVVDTPPLLNEAVLSSFDLTQEFVLITTLDIPALKNLRLALDTLDALGYDPATRHIVLNRANAKVELTPNDVERTLGTTIAVYIASSRDVPLSVNRGQVLVASEPQHPVSVSIRHLAKSRITAARPIQADLKHNARSTTAFHGFNLRKATG
jgi:pilus assembly protein CpaE